MGKSSHQLFETLLLLLIASSLVKCEDLNLEDGGTQIRPPRSVGGMANALFGAFGGQTATPASSSSAASDPTPYIVIKVRMPGMTGSGGKKSKKTTTVAIGNRPPASVSASGHTVAVGPAPVHHFGSMGPVIIQQIPVTSMLKQHQQQQQQQQFFGQAVSPPPAKIFTQAPPNYRPLQIKSVASNSYQNYNADKSNFNYRPQSTRQAFTGTQNFADQTADSPKINYYPETPSVADYSEKLNLNLNKNTFPAYMTADFQGHKVPVLYMPLYMPMPAPVPTAEALTTAVKNSSPSSSPSYSPSYSQTPSPIYSHSSSPGFSYTSSPTFSHTSSPTYSHSPSYTSSQNGGKFPKTGEYFLGKMASYMKTLLPGKKSKVEGGHVKTHPRWSSIRSWRSRLPKVVFGKAITSPTPKIAEHDHSIDLY